VRNSKLLKDLSLDFPFYKRDQAREFFNFALHGRAELSDFIHIQEVQNNKGLLSTYFECLLDPENAKGETKKDSGTYSSLIVQMISKRLKFMEQNIFHSPNFKSLYSNEERLKFATMLLSSDLNKGEKLSALESVIKNKLLSKESLVSLLSEFQKTVSGSFVTLYSQLLTSYSDDFSNESFRRAVITIMCSDKKLRPDEKQNLVEKFLFSAFVNQNSEEIEFIFTALSGNTLLTDIHDKRFAFSVVKSIFIESLAKNSVPNVDFISLHIFGKSATESSIECLRNVCNLELLNPIEVQNFTLMIYQIYSTQGSNILSNNKRGLEIVEFILNSSVIKEEFKNACLASILCYENEKTNNKLMRVIENIIKVKPELEEK
jgi:hypothetical protein